MVRLPKNIYRDALNTWYNSHRYTDDACIVPYRTVETKFRLEGYSKKSAFKWIVELNELYDFELKGNYIHFRVGM